MRILEVLMILSASNVLDEPDEPDEPECHGRRYDNPGDESGDGEVNEHL
jgi:hypothetical protein